MKDQLFTNDELSDHSWFLSSNTENQETLEQYFQSDERIIDSLEFYTCLYYEE